MRKLTKIFDQNCAFCPKYLVATFFSKFLIFRTVLIFAVFRNMELRLKTKPVDNDAGVAVSWSSMVLDESSIEKSELITEIAKLQTENYKQAKEIEQLRAEIEKLQNQSTLATVPKFDYQRRNESKLAGKMMPNSVAGEMCSKRALKVKLSATKIILFVVNFLYRLFLLKNTFFR